jgi:endonuclease III
MKNATKYAQKVKRLYGKIKKEAQKDPPVEVNGTMETLLLGILSRSTTEKKAAEALSRLNESTVDMNDLRVTPVAELVQIIGVSYPQSRPIAEEISAVLASIYNQVHEVDLGFLKSLGKKAAAGVLDSLDGLSQHANAFFTLRHLGSSAVALDDQAFEYLLKTDHLPEGTSIEDAHKFLRTHVKESDAAALSAALKLHARSPAGKKEMRGNSPRKTKVAKASKTTKKKKTAVRTTKSRGTAARTATKTKAAPKKTTAKKKHRR